MAVATPEGPVINQDELQNDDLHRRRSEDHQDHAEQNAPCQAQRAPIEVSRLIPEEQETKALQEVKGTIIVRDNYQICSRGRAEVPLRETGSARLGPRTWACAARCCGPP